MAKPNITISLDHPDPRVLNTLDIVRHVCLIVVAVVSTILLCAWLNPTVAHLLPVGWGLMKANTALCALLCVGSLALSNPKFPSGITLISRSVAVFVILLATAVLYEYITGRNLGIDTLFSSDILSQHPGRMSPHTAACFVLLGIIVLCIHVRKHLLSHVVDGITLCLVFMILIFRGCRKITFTI